MMYYVLHYIFLEICTFIVDNKLQKLRRKTGTLCVSGRNFSFHLLKRCFTCDIENLETQFTFSCACAASASTTASYEYLSKSKQSGKSLRAYVLF